MKSGVRHGLGFRIFESGLPSGRGAQAPWLALIHGLGSNSGQFDVLDEALGGGARILKLDLPGHGDRPLGDPSEIGFDGFARKIIALCDDLGVQDAHLAGISMGAALALKLAAARPDLARSVTAIRPAWLLEPSPPNLAIIDRIGQWFEDREAPEVLAALRADPEFQAIQARTPLAAASLESAVTRPRAREFSPVLSRMVRDRPFAALAALEGIGRRVAVLACAEDALHPVAIAQAHARAIPGARLVTAPPRYLEPEAHADAIRTEIARALAETLDPERREP